MWKSCQVEQFLVIPLSVSFFVCEVSLEMCEMYMSYRGCVPEMCEMCMSYRGCVPEMCEMYMSYKGCVTEMAPVTIPE